MVEGEGFEPSKAEPTDLQSVPFDRSGTPPAVFRPQKRAIVALSAPAGQPLAGRKGDYGLPSKLLIINRMPGRGCENALEFMRTAQTAANPPSEEARRQPVTMARTRSIDQNAAMPPMA